MISVICVLSLTIVLLFCLLNENYVLADTIKSFTLKSSVFSNGSMIPRKYTCDGENISPELIWENSPIGTVSYVLICEDPDAPVGIWVHWILYNIPVTVQALPDNILIKSELVSNLKIFMGINDFRKLDYGGPCPPPGKPHRYFFHLFALDITLEAKHGLNRDQILDYIKGHVLSEAQLIGLYGR